MPTRLSEKKRTRSRTRRASRELESAYARHRAGDLGGAEQAYRRVLALDPGNAPALSHLAAFEHRRGNLESAQALLSRAVESDPDDVGARNNLGNLFQALGRPAEAQTQYREALRLEPSHLSARYNLGKALQRLGDLDAAVSCFEDLCARSPNDAGAWVALALARQDTGRSDQAFEPLRRALAIEPRHPEAHNSLGTLHVERGEFAEAEAAFHAALRCDPGFSPALLNLVHTRRIHPRDADLVARIEALTARKGPAGEEAADLHFALGKAREDLGDFERAFRHYQEGNRQRRRGVRHDRRMAEKRAAAIAHDYDADFFLHTAGQGDPSSRPVFIVGMPRSGTSLVEQILASHPDCFGAGELPNLGLQARSLGARPSKRILELEPEELAALGRAYLESLPADSAGAARVTDKMPANWLHLGLAAAVLPGARVIWCRRDAMDVCFSIYAQQFTHQDAYPYAFDLEDIASEYRCCERLMEHWTRTLPIPLHEVRYERLVEDLEGVTASLLEFCGLPFDARCLRFHETDRRVGTASNWQVRQPLYRSSLARWRLFESQLGPLRSALGHAGAGG